MEEWRPVIGYEGLYEVSNTGKVRAKENKEQDWIELSTAVLMRGYPTILLNKNGIKKREKVHRLVAKAFIPNPLNKRVVEHKNKIKEDNSAENLEWVDDVDKHDVYRTCHANARKPILQIKGGVVLNEYESIFIAGKSIAKEYEKLGLPIPKVPETPIGIAAKKGTYAYGYQWKYKKDIT